MQSVKVSKNTPVKTGLKVQNPERTYFSDYNLIVPGIFIGNDETAKDKLSLKLMNVTHILVAGTQLQICFPSDFQYLKLDVRDNDTENISKYFEQASDFIKKGKESGGVLIHCKYGVSRSSTLLIAYVMREHRIPFSQSFNLIKSKRSVIQPNIGFITQLKAYEKKLLK